jgi:hypothetical protein
MSHVKTEETDIVKMTKLAPTSSPTLPAAASSYIYHYHSHHYWFQVISICRAVFTHWPKGPGPRAANFQGRHVKKNSRLKYGMWGKKGCPRERNLREIYTENTVMFCLLSVFCVVFA